MTKFQETETVELKKSTSELKEAVIQKSQLRIILRPVEYADPKGLVQQIPAGYNWTLGRSVYLKPGDDLDYVFGLIEQSYKDVL
jgi:predicted transport protein